MDHRVIDSCCLINLFAVGQFGEWLPVLGFSWHVPRAVRGETLYLRDWDEDGTPRKTPIDLQQEIDQGTLAACDVMAGAETALYVQLAVDLNDGEAMALAIARTRGWGLATDDRRAQRVAATLNVDVLTTPDLMHKWAGAVGVGEDKIGRALRRIEKHARFRPSEDDVLYQWWSRLTGGSGEV